ncbi:MAG TPA: hypothetical protein VK430_10075 [Xanthobacteraceae bacterium]|nr:hypothetical protein [Xanthobacteraceae bacterium]
MNVAQQRERVLRTFSRIVTHEGLAKVAQRGLERIAQRRVDLALTQRKGDILNAFGREQTVGRRRPACRDLGFDPADRSGQIHELAGECGKIVAHGRLDTGDGAEEPLRIGLSAAACVFSHEPAAALGRHDLSEEGIVIRVLRRSGQNFRQRQRVVGHPRTSPGRLTQHSRRRSATGPLSRYTRRDAPLE